MPPLRRRHAATFSPFSHLSHKGRKRGFFFPSATGALPEQSCQSIFSLKRVALQVIRPVVSRKKRGFPLTSGRALCRHLAFHSFQKRKNSSGVPFPMRLLSPRTATIEHFQFEMLRISNHTACRFAEKCVFSAHFGPGGAVPPPRISPFSKVKRSKTLQGQNSLSRAVFLRVNLQKTKHNFTL